MDTTTITPVEHVESIEQLMAGCNDGVAMIAVDIISTDIITKVMPAKKDELTLRKINNFVEIITEISLDYDAGYQVHFTAALEADPIIGAKGKGMSIDGISQFLKENKDRLYFFLTNPSIGLAYSENICMTIQNPAVLKFLEDHGYIASSEAADASFDVGTGVNVEVAIKDDLAVNFIDSLQSQLALKVKDGKEHQYWGKTYTMPSGFRDKLSGRVIEKVNELLSCDQLEG